jgi:hypothetical protein
MVVIGLVPSSVLPGAKYNCKRSKIAGFKHLMCSYILGKFN